VCLDDDFIRPELLEFPQMDVREEEQDWGQDSNKNRALATTTIVDTFVAILARNLLPMKVQKLPKG
jgi:hypothetical protein